ncbi:MAG: ABC transporter ATP-binding protein [Ideonella sp.]|nr:ABC transporter ATP-binding protein [Ideonella sp.]
MTALRPPLLALRGLTLEATASGQRVVDDLSLEIESGAVLAIVGESGSGKTLAARAVLGLLPTGIARTRGQILLNGEDLAAASDDRWRDLRGATMGMVFQEPMVSLNPAHRIGTQMEEGLVLHTALNAAERKARCLDMLRRVQIDDPMRCYGAHPHEFSGGMRQRIMLASVMLLKPRLLIADEPTTALDTLTQREVLDLMLALARDEGTAILLITHNLGLVARYAQQAVVMEKGRVVEQGEVRQVLHAPRTDYTRALVDALPRRLPAKAPTAPTSALIRVRSLHVSYPGARQGWLGRREDKHAVQGVSLDIAEGETLAVVGGSGSGKTTLARAVLRLVESCSGEIRFRNTDVRTACGAELHDFRMACQLVFQDPFSSLDPRQRVVAIVEEPLRLLPDFNPQRAALRAAEVLDEVGLSGYGARFPHELSGGQRQRVAIARAIVRRPALVVADEPVSALDMTIQAQVLRLFKDLQRQHGFACLFISHDLAVVEQVADRVLVMQAGRIVESGTRDALFDAPTHPYTRALLQAAPTVQPQPP